MPDDFISGIMPSDIFAHDNWISLVIKCTRRVYPAGFTELLLEFSQFVRQGCRKFRIQGDIRTGVVKLVGQLLNRGSAAYSAGRIHRRQANRFGLEDNVVSQLHVQDVISVRSE